MTGVVPIRALYRDTRFQMKFSQRNSITSFMVGAAFALGWSPCIGPPLAMILTIAGSSETAMQGVALLTIYSAGLAVPFLIAGWSIEHFFGAFARIKRHFRKFEMASGCVLMAVGVLLATNQFATLNSKFSFMTNWVAAAERAIQ
jgi:cytochrome c-type biogenesis protein